MCHGTDFTFAVCFFNMPTFCSKLFCSVYLHHSKCGSRPSSSRVCCYMHSWLNIWSAIETTHLPWLIDTRHKLWNKHKFSSESMPSILFPSSQGWPHNCDTTPVYNFTATSTGKLMQLGKLYATLNVFGFKLLFCLLLCTAELFKPWLYPLNWLI